MIASFRHKGLRDFWTTGSKKGIPAALAPRIEIIPDALDAAAGIGQLNVPGFKLHQLKGDRQGEWPSGSAATGASRSNSSAATPTTSTLRTITRREI